ncbi:TPA: ribbon-helix-helix domain-containing protein [Pasteurella multocida]|nr:ribbon-helix-helix domain-containing protein [Pasteurella multocida]HDX1177489.1 ribbon-helix-helix domain-containing protein [Pasteurella multocida]
MISKDKVRVVSYIDKDLRDKLSVLEKDTGVNVSQIISVALSSIINERSPEFEELLPKRELEKKYMKVSFTLSEIEAIKTFSKFHGHSFSDEVIFRVLSTLSKEPKLFDNELQELTSLKTALNQIGRNINHIAKKTSNDINHKNLQPFLEDVSYKISLVDKKLEAIISKSRDRWAFVSKKNG